jgi:hypothetical protein
VSVYRVLRHLISVSVDKDGDDIDDTNQRWEWKQFTINQTTLSPSLQQTHKTITSSILTSSTFNSLFPPTLSAVSQQEAGQLLCALVVMIGRDEDGGGGGIEKIVQLEIFSSMIVLLSKSSLFQHQWWAASACRVLLSIDHRLRDFQLNHTIAGSDVISHLMSDVERCLRPLLQNNSVHVASVAAECMEIRGRRREQEVEEERMILSDVLRRWHGLIERRRCEKDEDDPNEESSALRRLEANLLRLQWLISADQR